MWMNYLMERVVEYHRFTGGLLNKEVLQLSKSDLIYLFSVFFFSAEYTLKLALGQYFQIMKTNLNQQIPPINLFWTLYLKGTSVCKRNPKQANKNPRHKGL